MTGAGRSGTGTLAAFAGGRDNNFNLIRFLAAAGVLFGHALPISGVPASAFEHRVSQALSAGSVDVFFALSGFLVTASLFARGGLADFARARVLRIYPVLFVASFAGAFVIGPLVTRLALGDYLRSAETWRYAAQNAFLIWPLGVRFTLPGVFEGAPIARAVNGSLWTLPWELSMYVMLTLAGAIAFHSRLSNAREGVRRALVALAAVASVALALNGAFQLSSAFRVVEGLRFFALFLAGAAFQVLRDRIPLTWPLALASFAALMVAFAGRGRFDLLYAPAVTYAVLWLAYVPGGALRAYNRLGDYSYGLYAYAFPIEQLVVERVPGVAWVGLVLRAGIITLAVAALSWHWLEKPMLALKSRAPRG